MNTTPRRVQRSESVDSRKPAPFKQQFAATEKWNNIINTFLKGCPRGRHRRQFTYVDNSFTGKEAVDYMMEAIPTTLLNGRQVTRENCTKLLQKFLEEKHFFRYGSHEGRPVFKDSNWLYCFFTTITTKPQTPKLVRASTFNSSSVRLRQDSPTVQSTEAFNGIIPSSPGRDSMFDRRRSMSCSNLAEVTLYEIPTKKFERRSREPVRVNLDVTPTCDRTRDETVEKDDNTGTLTKLMDKLNRRRRSPSSPIPTAEPRLLSKTPLVTTPCTAPTTRIVVTPVLNEIDMWSVYKSCLLTRVREVLGSENFDFSWHIKGSDIKWNSEKVDNTGMVIPRAKSDTYSDYILRLINYLKMFPFPNEKVNAVKYDEYQETKVFNVLCSNLEKASPLLTEDEASAILHVMSHFDEMTRKEVVTRPVRMSPPLTRLRARQMPRTPVSCCSSSSNASTPMSTVSTLPSALYVNGLEDQIAFSVSSSSPSSLNSFPYSRSTRSATSTYSASTCRTPTSRSLSDSIHDISIDSARSLPGLIMTPEIEQKIREYYSSTERSPVESQRTHSGLSYVTAKTSFSPYGNNLCNKQYEDMRLSITLILVTLPTSRRWKLHTLLRMMHKMATDENLRLDPNARNYDIILDKLTKCIVPFGRTINAKQALDIVRLLLAAETNQDLDQFFVVDKKLAQDVKNMATSIQQQRAIATEQPELNNAPTPPTNVLQFCEPATNNMYNEQSTHTMDFLLPLLDEIINDENMKQSEKERKLKQFRTAHPEVYSKRLPLGEVHDNDGKRNFFRRVFGK